MDRMPKRPAVKGFSSTFSLPTMIRPLKSEARASTVGATRRQGPHHSAQKSTKTGVEAWITDASKFPSVST